jgi:manganese transport protein
MEGFLNIRIQPWLRRMVTRFLAIAPAAIVIWISGNDGTFKLLILSQVVLNLQLPFAIIPLIHFTSDRKKMGTFANGWKLRFGGWLTAAIVVGLNLWLAGATIASWAADAGRWAPMVWTLSIALAGAVLSLLLWVTVQPLRRTEAAPIPTLGLETALPQIIEAPSYRRILVPLDHSPLDRLALSHAAGMASRHGASLLLLHVEEGVTSQIYGHESSTAEVEAGREYIESLVSSLSALDLKVETAIRHGANPRKEIVRYAREMQPDLLVMGAHGHGGLKDLIFGNTINPVRHALNIPILVVRSD